MPDPVLVIHFTQGTSIDGAVTAMRTAKSEAHEVVDPARVGPDGGPVTRQLLPWTTPARSLRHPAGTPETNNRGWTAGSRLGRCYQIEVVGYSERATTYPDDWYQRLAGYLHHRCAALGIPTRFPYRFVANGYGVTAPQRLTWDAWATVAGIVGHQHVPGNCVTADTPVLTADLRWVPAGELQPGDELIGFDEHSTAAGSTAGRRLRPATVEHNHLFRAHAYRVVTDHGELITTAEHPWLVRLPYVNRGTRTHWVTTADLDPAKHSPYWACTPWASDRSHTAGWLAGMLDADGHAQTNRSSGAWVGFGQVYNGILTRFVEEMESRGFTIKTFDRQTGRRLGKQAFCDVRVLGGLWEQLRALGTLRPYRLDLRAAWDGAVIGKTCPQQVTIYAIEPAGDRWMAGMQTSTSTYIANGFLVHNSHWDPGALDVTRLTRYMETTTTVPTPAPLPENDPGARIQRAINANGLQPPLDIDGDCGKVTADGLDKVLAYLNAQVAKFQAANAASASERDQAQARAVQLADAIKRLTDARMADAKLVDAAVANREAAEAEAAKLRAELQTGGRMPQLLADLDAALAKARA